MFRPNHVTLLLNDHNNNRNKGNEMGHVCYHYIYHVHHCLTLPPSSVSINSHEVSGPSPFLVNPNILMQYHVNGVASRRTTEYTSSSTTVVKRCHWSVSESRGSFKWPIALIVLNVSLYPRIMPFCCWSGIGFHLTAIAKWFVFSTLIFCGGMSGAEGIKYIFYDNCRNSRALIG